MTWHKSYWDEVNYVKLRVMKKIKYSGLMHINKVKSMMGSGVN